MLDRQLFKDWSDHPAGTTPFSPEINKDQPLSFRNLFVKILISDLNNFTRRHASLPIPSVVSLSISSCSDALAGEPGKGNRTVGFILKERNAAVKL